MPRALPRQLEKRTEEQKKHVTNSFRTQVP
jgi:hypothetical protein